VRACYTVLTRLSEYTTTAYLIACLSYTSSRLPMCWSIVRVCTTDIVAVVDSRHVLAHTHATSASIHVLYSSIHNWNQLLPSSNGQVVVHSVSQCPVHICDPDSCYSVTCHRLVSLTQFLFLWTSIRVLTPF
jgi:hypothetical protein